jgi:hypothetical protein
MSEKLAHAVGLILILEAQTKHSPGTSPEKVTLCDASRAQLQEALREADSKLADKVERTVAEIVFRGRP